MTFDLLLARAFRSCVTLSLRGLNSSGTTNNSDEVAFLLNFAELLFLFWFYYNCWF